jgi:excisionase family DNA binding protein
MQIQNNIEEYLSTGQAAKLLGLTIATIQKMTENGILSAYMTPGGHRRILYSSFNHYCDANSLKETQSTTNKHLVCIMHNPTSVSSEITSISEFPNVKVICTPLELLGLQRSNISLFMDARLPWLDETIFQTTTELVSEAHIYLYNSEALPTNSTLKSNPNWTVIEGDINRHLIFGYLLINKHSPTVSSSLEILKEHYLDRPKFSSASSNRLKKALSMNGKRINKPAKPAVNVTGKPTA